MAKSLDEGFSTFLGWLVPLTSENDKVLSHKDSVYSCLNTKHKCYELFETGSYGAGTGIRHHSDTDYFAVIPSNELYESSGHSLREIKESLEATFWSTEGIVVSCPSVRIPFGTYASETMEVSPCYFSEMLDTPLGKYPAYKIADCNDGWMLSSPKAHNSYVEKQDSRLSYRLKKLIRLVKAWKYYNAVPILSFYLELRVTKYAEGEESILYDIDLKRFLKWLLDNDLPSIQDPMGISGLISACSTSAKRTETISKLTTAVGRAEKAVSCREDDIDTAFYYWGLLFNGEFPAR